MSKRGRVRTVIQTAIPIAVIVGADIIIFQLIGLGIPCPIRLATGYRCPGCGMTHAFGAMLHGEFSRAVAYNALSVSVVPITGLYLLYRVGKYVKRGQENFRAWEIILLYALLAVTVGYGIVRNI